ncbi:Bifunctional purine biosynthesis protein ATIC [Manis javanica]|nr:Bifunctional purine biosynthesis protein ATIC [Manis javanica]
MAPLLVAELRRLLLDHLQDHQPTGIVESAQGLHALGIKLLSTGGTAKLLAEAGLPVTEVAEVTQFPEMMDGRVKTLHPASTAACQRRELPAHMALPAEHGIDTIDLLRNLGKLSDKLRFALSVAAFNRIAQYDGAISDYLSSVKFEDEKLSEAYVPERSPFPARATATSPRCRTCPTAKTATSRPPCPATCIRLPAPWSRASSCRARSFPTTTSPTPTLPGNASRVSRAAGLRDRQARQPLRRGRGKDAHEAYARPSRPTPPAPSAASSPQPHGGQGSGEAVVKQFVEVLIAPDFTSQALEIFKPKVNVRLMKIALPAGGERAWDQGPNAMDAKRVGSGPAAADR